MLTRAGTELVSVGGAKISACGVFRRYVDCRDAGIVVDMFLQKCKDGNRIGGYMRYGAGFKLVVHV